MTRPDAPRNRVLLGLAIAAVGLFPALVGFGVIKLDPPSIHAPLWVIAMVGLAFMFAGAAAMLGPDEDGGGGLARALRLACALAVIAAIASVSTWVAFGPGEREFTSGGGAGGFEVSGGGDPAIGRIVFGVGAVLMWGFFLLALFQGVRVLRKPPGNH